MEMKFIDHAAAILKSAVFPPLTQDQKSDLWTLYHTSKDANELSGHLSEVNLHPELKQQLITAKGKPTVEFDDVDKAIAVMHRLAALPQATLDLVEKHPHVFGHMMDEVNGGTK